MTDGYAYSQKQDVITYAIFSVSQYNEGLLTPEEFLRLLFFMIDYSVKDRKFKLSEVDNINDNFRVSVVIALLEHVHERKFRDLKHRLFLVLFQLYVLSRSYISSQQEFKVIECIRRLYPNLNIVKRNDANKIAGIYKLLEVN